MAKKETKIWSRDEIKEFIKKYYINKKGKFMLIKFRKDHLALHKDIRSGKYCDPNDENEENDMEKMLKEIGCEGTTRYCHPNILSRKDKKDYDEYTKLKKSRGEGKSYKKLTDKMSITPQGLRQRYLKLETKFKSNQPK